MHTKNKLAALVFLLTMPFGLSVLAQDENTGFDIDLSYLDAARRTGEVLLSDLGVGDKAFIYMGELCLNNGALSIGEWARTKERSEYALNGFLEILPSGRAAIELLPGTKVNDVDKKKHLMDNLFILWDCSTVAGIRKTENSRIFTVQSIDGYTSLSSFFEANNQQNDDPDQVEKDYLGLLFDTTGNEDKEDNWRIEKTTDPIDDSPAIVASIRETGNNNHSYSGSWLLIRCLKNTTSFILNTGKYLGPERRIPVVYRIDDNAPKNDLWLSSMSKKSAGLWNGAESIPFIRSLLGVERLVVEFRPKDIAPVTMIFNLSGLENALDPVAQGCEWSIVDASSN